MRVVRDDESIVHEQEIIRQVTIAKQQGVPSGELYVDGGDCGVSHNELLS